MRGIARPETELRLILIKVNRCFRTYNHDSAPRKSVFNHLNLYSSRNLEEITREVSELRASPTPTLNSQDEIPLTDVLGGPLQLLSLTPR